MLIMYKHFIKRLLDIVLSVIGNGTVFCFSRLTVLLFLETSSAKCCKKTEDIADNF